MFAVARAAKSGIGNASSAGAYFQLLDVNVWRRRTRLAPQSRCDFGGRNRQEGYSTAHIGCGAGPESQIEKRRPDVAQTVHLDIFALFSRRG